MLLKFLLSMLVYITSIISIFKLLICENNSLKRYQWHNNGWRETSLHRYRYLFIVLRRKHVEQQIWTLQMALLHHWRIEDQNETVFISDISDLSWNSWCSTRRCRAHHQTLTSHCISVLFTLYNGWSGLYE